MKKLLGIFAIAGVLTACGNNQQDESLNKQYMTDTTMTREDFSMGYTADVNGLRG